MMRHRRAPLLLSLLLTPLVALSTWGSETASPALATSPAGPPAISELRQLNPELFPFPPELSGNVRFWIEAFALHDSQQVLIHDELYPGRIFRVLDFSALMASPVSEVEKRRRRDAIVKGGLSEIALLLRQMAAGRTPETEEAKRVAAYFGPLPGAKADLLGAAGRLRSQTGLKDHFLGAIQRSGRYLPTFERVFRDRGLPTELTRLPFVESMFQGHARSKVAAGGMWQIMPSTGRLYMRVGHDVDERFDPFLAAEAAARILAENYQRLRAWPLAITAYNHGQGGIARAVSQLGTRDIGIIATRYQGRLFGFASRNFYAEFLAAALIYENRERYFPGIEPLPQLQFEEFVADRYVSAVELAAAAQLEVTQLADLNPAVHDSIWTGQLFLPAGYRLKVPHGHSEAIRNAYAAIPAERKLLRQGGSQHRVRRGETLGTIARRYGTTVAALQRLNGLSAKSRLRTGQTLRVPPPAVRVAPQAPDTVATLAAPAPAPTNLVVPVEPAPSNPTAGQPAGIAGQATTPPGPEPAAGESPDFHVVAPGDTLFGIAQRYDTSIQTLRQLNRLGKSGKIFPGQKLKLRR
jgi:membrane-bound lytic murein transglycosylase D